MCSFSGQFQDRQARIEARLGYHHDHHSSYIAAGETLHFPPHVHPKQTRKKIIYVALILTLKLTGNDGFHFTHYGRLVETATIVTRLLSSDTTITPAITAGQTGQTPHLPPYYIHPTYKHTKTTCVSIPRLPTNSPPCLAQL